MSNKEFLSIAGILLEENSTLQETIKKLQKELETKRNNNNNNKTTPSFGAIKQQYSTWGGSKG